MHVLQDHLQRWVLAGTASILPVETSRALGQHLEGLPWEGTHLDWKCLRVRAIDLSRTPAAELPAAFADTLIGQDSHVVFLFEPEEPSIVCEADFAFDNLDAAFWKAPGTRYMFGASIELGGVTPRPAHWASYDGADTLRAAL